MTGVFLAARRTGFLDEVPPHKAIRSVAPQVPELRLSILSAAAHFLVGAMAGALFGALFPRRLVGSLSGALFGVGVWVFGYEAVMPTATDIPPAHRDVRKRALTILVAHLVYGIALGMPLKILDRRTRPAP